MVLNNTEDWLNPDYRATSVPYDVGGQAEFYIQAVNWPAWGAAAAESLQMHHSLRLEPTENIGNPAAGTAPARNL